MKSYIALEVIKFVVAINKKENSRNATKTIGFIHITEERAARAVTTL